LSCSASGIFAICCDLTRPTITRFARTFHSTRTRRRREPYIPLVALCLRHFLADFIICMCEFDFRQAQVPAETDRIENWAAIWATDTIAVSKQAMANVSYKKTGPGKWTVEFSDRDTYLQDADKLKRQQLAKAGARLAAIVSRFFP
jgi:hypothetical protein